MSESDRPTVRLKLGVPGILSLESDDLVGLLGDRVQKKGPFLIVGREHGLALETADKNDPLILWSPHGKPHQLWHLVRTRHRREFLVISASNGMALDARIWSELPRDPVMWPPHAEPHQRWRFHRTDDHIGYIIESVLTGQVLDVPSEAERLWHPCMWDRNDGFNQQFTLLSVRSAMGG